MWLPPAANKRAQRRPSRHTEGFVFSETETDAAVPAALIQAFRETHYKVYARPNLAEVAFTLRIDQACVDLKASQRLHGVDCSAYITACNPNGQALGPADNAHRQKELARELRARGLAFDAGIGQHPSNGWEGEPSFLVYGLDLEAAKALGRRFGQIAIVWSGGDAVPRLVVLR
jgi:hypothetical protein